MLQLFVEFGKLVAETKDLEALFFFLQEDGNSCVCVCLQKGVFRVVCLASFAELQNMGDCN